MLPPSQTLCPLRPGGICKRREKRFGSVVDDVVAAEAAVVLIRGIIELDSVVAVAENQQD